MEKSTHFYYVRQYRLNKNYKKLVSNLWRDLTSDKKLARPSHNSKSVPQSQLKKCAPSHNSKSVPQSQLKKCDPVTTQKVCPSHNSNSVPLSQLNPTWQTVSPRSVQTKVQAAYRVSSEFTTVRRRLSFSDYTATPRSKRATAAVSLDRFTAWLVCGRPSGLGTPTTVSLDAKILAS